MCSVVHVFPSFSLSTSFTVFSFFKRQEQWNECCCIVSGKWNVPLGVESCDYWNNGNLVFPKATNIKCTCLVSACICMQTSKPVKIAIISIESLDIRDKKGISDAPYRCSKTIAQQQTWVTKVTGKKSVSKQLMSCYD